MNFPRRIHPATISSSAAPRQTTVPQAALPTLNPLSPPPTPPPIPIIVTVGIRNGGLELLPHWLCHYASECAPCHLRLTLIGDSARLHYEVAHCVVACDLGEDITVTLRSFPDPLAQGHEEQIKALAEIHRDPREWYVWTDLDEMHKINNQTIREAVEHASTVNRTAIFGYFVDRTTSDGALVTIRPDVSLWEQFPVESEFGRKNIRIFSDKVIAARWDQRVLDGHHNIDNQRRYGPYHKVHHFRWTAATLERLRAWSQHDPRWKYLRDEVQVFQRHLHANGGKIRVR